VDKTKTDLYMHLVEREDNSIYDVTEVLMLKVGSLGRRITHEVMIFSFRFPEHPSAG